MKLALHSAKIKEVLRHRYTVFYGIPALIFLTILTLYFYTRSSSQEHQLQSLTSEKVQNETQLKKENEILLKGLTDLKNRDEYKVNQANTLEIKNIQSTYRNAVTAYEYLLKPDKCKPE